jgi:Mn-dependent DtxR family transcriptional regulator
MSKEANDLSSLLSELQDIKKLFILSLLQQGISQNDVAAALNINPSTVTRMLPKGLGKKLRAAGSK